MTSMKKALKDDTKPISFDKSFFIFSGMNRLSEEAVQRLSTFSLDHETYGWELCDLFHKLAVYHKKFSKFDESEHGTKCKSVEKAVKLEPPDSPSSMCVNFTVNEKKGAARIKEEPNDYNLDVMIDSARTGLATDRRMTKPTDHRLPQPSASLFDRNGQSNRNRQIRKIVIAKRTSPHPSSILSRNGSFKGNRSKFDRNSHSFERTSPPPPSILSRIGFARDDSPDYVPRSPSPEPVYVPPEDSIVMNRHSIRARTGLGHTQHRVQRPFSGPKCTHCKMRNHTTEQCWKLKKKDKMRKAPQHNANRTPIGSMRHSGRNHV